MEINIRLNGAGRFFCSFSRITFEKRNLRKFLLKYFLMKIESSFKWYNYF